MAGDRPYPPTIAEACGRLGLDLPVSREDLRAVVLACNAAGVVTNCSGEAWWDELSELPLCPFCYAMSHDTVEDCPEIDAEQLAIERAAPGDREVR